MTAAAGAATPGIAYALALAIGIALALWMVPVGILLGGGAATALDVQDTAQHIIGQRYFIADGWHWPLLVVRALAGPDGSNIGLTDSIPLAALPARLLRGLLPPGGHLVHAWLALSYAAQPVAAVFALRSAGERRLLPALAVALVAVSMPALLARHGHAGLSAHFLLLLAIGLYFRLCGPGGRGTRAATLALPPVTLLVHVYLLAMVAAILAAAPLTLLLRRDRRWPATAATVAGGIALAAALGWALGYMAALPPDAGGFGLYSMNLLSPLRPSGSMLFPGFEGVLDATGGQWEGMNYLGAGALLLAAVGGVAVVAGVAPGWRRHLGLLAAALALTLLALSNRIYVGRHLLLDLGEAPPLLQQFRAGGRLFWPVGYLAALGGVLAAARLRPAWLAASVLVVAAGLQVADATSLRNAVHNLARTPFPWAVDADRLRAQLAASRHVTLLPAAGCGASLTVDDSWLQVVLLASERVRPINTMYLSRRTRLPTDCDAEGYVPLDDGELRVYVPPAVAAPFALPDRGRDCRVLGRIAVCSKADALLAGLPVVPAPDVTIPLGVTLSAGADGDPRPLLWGWSISVPGGTWSEGPSASIAGRLAGPPVAPLELTLAGMPYAPDGTAEGRVTVLLNERPLAVWPVRHLQAAVFHAALPPDVDLAAPFAIRLEFAPLPSGAPRHWRLWLTSLRIAAAG